MKYGEIIKLGRHRLMCGDATKAEDVHKLVGGERVNLVLTDPPYGIKIHGNYNFRINQLTGETRKVNPATHNVKMRGDNSTDTARRHYELVRGYPVIFWGGNYFTDFLPPKKGWLVWSKRQTLWNHSDCELAWTNLHTCIHMYEQLWSGACRSGSHALNPRPCVHPTQKPVELHAQILEDFSQPGDVILDCFGGSGTTLIACEVTGRRCLMMELSPDYCNVIINRYNTLTKGQIQFEDYPYEATEI